MNEMAERVAIAIFLAGYHQDQHAEAMKAWSDGDLSCFVSGPPFEADGYREMARAAIEAMREPTEAMMTEHSQIQISGYRDMIDEALK